MLPQSSSLDSLPCPPGAPLCFSAGSWSSARHQIYILPSRGISRARASATAPARHRKPPRRSGRAPGPPGHTRASRAGAAPLTPRPPLRQEGGGAAGAPAAGIHPRGAPQPSPGLSPPNLNSPQQEDLGGQGLRHGPSPAPQAAQVVREGSRSSGSHSRFARRCGAAHPAPSSTTGGGGGRRPRGRDPPTGRAPALTRPLAAPRPVADDFVGAPKPTSDPPGTARSGRHLELLFTGAAGSSYEGEPLAFHQFVPPDFSTGPRDTGAPCIALSAPLDHGN
ncbi:hypothetical protein NDU88_002261 [Pleurodeles waltl]|uniref:Uncharacterized protein n=1 Tax=Pleurodeles waltl TaxID=8319 RepID=A0AAV7R9I2_PLEWA|nr:hypothetical protein NDU88_002261 [Pleurodeles waltl]